MTPASGRLPPQAVFNGNQDVLKIAGKRLYDDARQRAFAAAGGLRPGV